MNYIINYVIISISMPTHVMKTTSILIAVTVAIFTFALMVMPVSADTPMDAMDDNCNCDCNTMPMQSSMPECCSISYGSFPDCGLPDVPDDEAMLPGRSTLNWDIHNGQYTLSISTEIDNGSKQLPEQEFPQLSSSCICSEFHCRNSLDSEDPFFS